MSPSQEYRADRRLQGGAGRGNWHGPPVGQEDDAPATGGDGKERCEQGKTSAVGVDYYRRLKNITRALP